MLDKSIYLATAQIGCQMKWNEEKNTLLAMCTKSVRANKNKSQIDQMNSTIHAIRWTKRKKTKTKQEKESEYAFILFRKPNVLRL